MAYGNIFHAICLHMHQPPDNLELLINANEEEARQIIHCYDRVTRYAHQYAEVAQLHIGFSGLLLEQLNKPAVIDRYRQHMDIPAMLNSYRQAENIELIDVGYYHPVFPLIPIEDWETHLLKGQQIIKENFGRAPRGFYPPAMAFTMEMIPLLVKAGYEYVIIDANCIKPYSEQLDIYQPYRACYEDACITVIPADPNISNAQINDLETYWFANEMYQRVQHSARPDAPRLLTSWSDGENSDWFRQMDEGNGFFGKFFAVYMDHVRSDRYPVKPLLISEFIRQHPAEVAAQIETGAWHVGDTVGYELPQWEGTEKQQQAVKKIRELSNRCRKLKDQILTSTQQNALAQVYRLILEAESSCFLFWGDAWLQRLYDRFEAIETGLVEIEKSSKSSSDKDKKGSDKTHQQTIPKGETSPVAEPLPTESKVTKAVTQNKPMVTTVDKSKQSPPVKAEPTMATPKKPEKTPSASELKTAPSKASEPTKAGDKKSNPSVKSRGR